MRKFIIIGLLLMCSAAFCGFIPYFSNDLEAEIVDARSEGLGRTAVLSASGSNSLFNNPALLGESSKQEIKLTGRLKTGRLEQNYSGDIEENQEFELPPHLKLSGLSYSLPFELVKSPDLNTSFAFGYRSYFDFSIKEEFDSSLDDYSSQHTYSGGYNTVVLGLGGTYQNKLSCGISYSMPFMSSFKDEYQNSTGTETITESDLNGGFFTLGSSWKASQMLKIGLYLRNKIELSSRTDTEDGYSENEYLIIPPELALGIELNPKANLSIFAEYRDRRLADYASRDYYNYTGYYGSSKNGYSIRTGVEFRSIADFRGGFILQSVPEYEIIDGIQQQDPLNEIAFSLGSGIKIAQQFRLDAYASYAFLNYDVRHDYEIGGDVYEIDYSYNMFKFGITLGAEF